MLEILRPGRDGGQEWQGVIREYSSVYDKAFYSAGKSSLPAEAVARVMLFKVYDKLSYGLILQSQDLVGSGYQVSNF